MAKPITDDQIREWYENFSRLAMDEAELDVTRKEDIGRIMAFHITGQTEMDDKTLNKKVTMSDGKLRYVCVPQNDAGYLGPEKDPDAAWVYERAQSPSTVEEKRILYNAAQNGTLILRDANGEMHQVYNKPDGTVTYNSDSVLGDKQNYLTEPEVPKAPAKPEKPGIWFRFWSAVTGGRAFKDKFTQYERDLADYPAKMDHFQKVDVKEYQKKKLAYDMQEMRRSVKESWVTDLNLNDEKAEKAQNDVTFWKAAHKSLKGKELAENKLNELDQEAEQIDRRVNKVMGPYFLDLPELTEVKPVYDKKKFHPDDFSWHVIKDSGLEPEEIGYLSLAAYTDPQYSGAGFEQNSHEFKTKEDFAVTNYYMAVDGIFTARREGIGNLHGPNMIKARSATEEALNQFLDGHPEQIGRLLANGIRMQEKEVRSASQMEGTLSRFCHITRKTLDILDKHPEYMKAAREYGGLTDQELKVARGVAKVETIEHEGWEAQKNIYNHVLNTIVDPAQGEKLPSQGELGVEANYKKVQLMQAVNFSVAKNFSDHMNSPESYQARLNVQKEVVKMGGGPRTLDMVQAVDNTLSQNAPLNSIYAALGNDNAIQKALDNTVLPKNVIGKINGEYGKEKFADVLLKQGDMTLKMSGIKDVFDNTAKLESMSQIMEASKALGAQPVKAQPVKAAAPGMSR